MTTFGFHASHEQVPPSALLEAVKLAESAGFQAAMCSDHFAPWGTKQGESGFAWSWLGAALEATSLRFGVVNAPGQRYHPAVVAQAAATLCEMYPDRFWIAVGSGEAMNEHITGDGWPTKEHRNARLEESVNVMRGLFAGELVSHDGLVKVDRAKLYSLPAQPPPIIGAAVSARTAGWLGGWADGLITINQDAATLKQVVESFRAGGGEGKRLIVQVHVSWAPTDDEALAIAHEQWRNNVFPPPIPWDLEMPEDFDKVGAHVRPEDVKEAVLASCDPLRHAEWLQGFVEAGFQEVYIHHVGKEQRAFIEVYGEKVLPELDRS